MKNTRKHLSKVQRVEDWDYNFVPLPTGGIPGEVFAQEKKLKLNGSSISLEVLRSGSHRQRHFRDFP